MVSVSPGAERIIHAWRMAHGLESAAAANLAMTALAPAFAQPAGW